MELHHVFFDSTMELSQQGYFQWIYSLQVVGTQGVSDLVFTLAVKTTQR